MAEFRGLPWDQVRVRTAGERCGHCNRLLKIYHRRLTSLSVAGMVRLFKLTKIRPDETYHHVRDLGVSKNGGEFAQSRWWGFCEEAPKEKDKDTRTSGMWRLTEFGIQFLKLQVDVPLCAVIRWNSTHIGFSGELIDARAALQHKNKFSYEDLMGVDATPWF